MSYPTLTVLPMTRPGPIYDGAMRILAADDLAALPSVVGVDGTGASALGTELPGSAVRVVTAVAEVIVAQPDPDRRRRLAHAATTLASMVLPRPIIRRALVAAVAVR